MKIVILQSSPNRDGLTAACAAAAERGAQAGGTIQHIRLNDLNIGLCAACDRGWGTCRDEHECQVQDDFQRVHDQVAEADALILVTPVYWGQPSESAKAFLDRFRRCEALRREESCLAGKLVLFVAAAGGGGGGTMTCLSELERWASHTRAVVWDLIPITQRSRGYKLETITQASQAMTQALG